MRPRSLKYLKWFCIKSLRMLALVSLVPFAVRSEAGAPRSARQTQAPQSIGSISSIGSVSINGRPAPADATIFPSDIVTTGETGSATFSISGKGSLKLAPHSEMSFAPDPRYSAELRAGTVVMNSFGGATDISVRAGAFVIAPVIQAQHSASKIERRADGSFTISCLDGSVGLIPLEGATGRVLQSGQSATLLPSGQLDQVPPGAEPRAETPIPTGPPAAPPPATVHGSSKKNEYILLGLAGGAAAVIAGALAGRGHGSSSVSPSTP
jgi:ferric-dicitrate binding protein FerR (iron transport regulator)